MPARSAFDWVLEVLAFMALAAIILIVAAHWTEIPAQVPRHFGVSGAPDGWGNKNGMLLLPLTAAVLYILMTVAARYPSLINILMAIDRDAPEVRRLLQSMSITLRTEVLFILGYMEWAMVNAALGRS